MVVETLIAVGVGAASVSVGAVATAVAVNWRRYAKSEWARVTGYSFWKHCNKKYFQFDVNRRKGYAGEHELSLQLEKVKGQKKVLYNVLIPAGKDKTTEIDGLMVHETGIYVFENKNYSGTVGCFCTNQHKKKILGNVQTDIPEWTVVYDSGKTAKMYNPLMQNEKHLYFIKRFLTGFNIGSQRLFSYITFNDNAKVKGAPLDFKFSYEGCMLMSKHLAEDLNARVGQRSRIITPNKIDAIVAKLEPYARVSDKEREEHADRVNAVTEQFQGDLEDGVAAPEPCVPLNNVIQTAQKQEKQQINPPENKIMKNYLNLFQR